MFKSIQGLTAIFDGVHVIYMNANCQDWLFWSARLKEE